MIFDLSDYGHVRVSGRDARPFLHNISTNDLLNLKDGEGCETYFCDHRAKTLFQTVAACDRDAILLTTAPGYAANLLKHLDKYLISEEVELEDATSTTAMMHLTGADAPELNLSEFRHQRIGSGLYRRVDRLGMPGYDLILPKGDNALKATGDDFEILRIEAGTPIYGKDIDENRFVMEIANAARAVSYTKGCFPGQEPVVMSRDRAGGVSRFFVGLKLGHLPAAGAKVTKDGGEVGVVTSCCDSPQLGAPLALAYIRKPHHEKGTLLEVSGQPAEVLGYPPLG